MRAENGDNWVHAYEEVAEEKFTDKANVTQCYVVFKLKNSEFDRPMKKSNSGSR